MRYTRMFWLNSTGPMIGMSDSTGTGSAGRRMERFHCPGLSDRTVEKKKLVRPTTRTLRTTPMMIWSTQ